MMVTCPLLPSAILLPIRLRGIIFTIIIFIPLVFVFSLGFFVDATAEDILEFVSGLFRKVQITRWRAGVKELKPKNFSRSFSNKQRYLFI